MQVSAKPVVKNLDCGRQTAGKAAKAEMALAGSIYTLSVTFFGQESRRGITKLVRAVLNAVEN
jgi:hypothetical protein